MESSEVAKWKSKRGQLQRRKNRFEPIQPNFLWDRVFGKPKQEMNVYGGVIHAHTRNPLLASLPKEALQELARKYDELTVHAMPVVNAAHRWPAKSNRIKHSR